MPTEVVGARYGPRGERTQNRSSRDTESSGVRSRPLVPEKLNSYRPRCIPSRLYTRDTQPRLSRTLLHTYPVYTYRGARAVLFSCSRGVRAPFGSFPSHRATCARIGACAPTPRAMAKVLAGHGQLSRFIIYAARPEETRSRLNRYTRRAALCASRHRCCTAALRVSFSPEFSLCVCHRCVRVRECGCVGSQFPLLLHSPLPSNCCTGAKTSV